MDTILFKLDNLVTLHQGVTPDEAQPIYEKVADNLRMGKIVELDFENIELATTAFLNVLIGALYKDYTTEQLKDRLVLKHISSDMATRIKKVTDNAKLFYSNKQQFEEILDDVIYGDGNKN
ncbi:MAG: STAS-like domain-containing protein [Muribaculaceae bacterium]|nr:STAS-like domain-containing protein [Muribaculaceae bacterium]